jgi:hypothetical protein
MVRNLHDKDVTLMLNLELTSEPDLHSLV